MLLLQEKIYLGSLYMLEGERAHFKLHLISDQHNSLLGYNSLFHDPAEIVFVAFLSHCPTYLSIIVP